jgi:hypothetical protein
MLDQCKKAAPARMRSKRQWKGSLLDASEVEAAVVAAAFAAVVAIKDTVNVMLVELKGSH